MATTEKMTVDSFGVLIKVTIVEDGTAVDVSTVSAKYIYLTAPDATVLTCTASFFTSGADGIIDYTTIAGDIDQIGIWTVQGFVTFSGGFSGKSLPGSFEVV